MDEYFLQYLWNFQKFDSNELRLSDGSSLKVFKTGHQNHNSGPDFLEAQIKIAELTWSGSVEIHYRSSDWLRHGHDKDPAYDNVVLHVVWQHDTHEIRIHGRPIPTLELKHYVSANVESAYRHYINQPLTIRCSEHLPQLEKIHIQSMIDRALAARLKQKAKQVTALLNQCDGDWEEATYRVISKNFGFKINQDSFVRLAQSLPYKVLRKYQQKEKQVYALVYGMAGYLDNPTSEYQTALRDEFEYLKGKHQLKPNLMRHHWRHSKMRPANFPSVRLAQFAAFIAHTDQLFAQLLEIHDSKGAERFMARQLPEYWQGHYDFDKPASKKLKLGKSSIHVLIINSVVPILTAYSKYLDEVKYMERAYDILESLNTESNHKLDQWKSFNVIPKNAGDSQGLIYQYSEFCERKKCLKCNIGISILNKQIAS